MIEKPKQDNGMFFIGMEFNPTPDLKQSDVNRLVVHIFRQLFSPNPGEIMQIKEYDKSLQTLVQFMIDLNIRLDEKAFENVPDDLKKFFKVIHRDGTKYQHGAKPRF